MLIVKLRNRQRVQVGPATISILSVEGGQVQLGIEAPREVRISEIDKPLAPPPTRFAHEDDE